MVASPRRLVDLGPRCVALISRPSTCPMESVLALFHSGLESYCCVLNQLLGLTCARWEEHARRGAACCTCRQPSLPRLSLYSLVIFDSLHLHGSSVRDVYYMVYEGGRLRLFRTPGCCSLQLIYASRARSGALSLLLGPGHGSRDVVCKLFKAPLVP